MVKSLRELLSSDSDSMKPLRIVISLLDRPEIGELSIRLPLYPTLSMPTPTLLMNPQPYPSTFPFGQPSTRPIHSPNYQFIHHRSIHPTPRHPPYPSTDSPNYRVIHRRSTHQTPSHPPNHPSALPIRLSIRPTHSLVHPSSLPIHPSIHLFSAIAGSAVLDDIMVQVFRFLRRNYSGHLMKPISSNEELLTYRLSQYSPTVATSRYLNTSQPWPHTAISTLPNRGHIQVSQYSPTVATYSYLNTPQPWAHPGISTLPNRGHIQDRQCAIPLSYHDPGHRQDR